MLSQDPLLVFQISCIGLSKVSLMPGSLDVPFHQVHRLSEFFVLFDEGFHPLYQLVPLLGSQSYPLQIHNYNDELRSPTSKMTTPDAVLTSICFITPARAVVNLLICLVVSSSSITTT